jgi:hypothetical protein
MPLTRSWDCWTASSEGRGGSGTSSSLFTFARGIAGDQAGVLFAGLGMRDKVGVCNTTAD